MIMIITHVETTIETAMKEVKPKGGVLGAFRRCFFFHLWRTSD